MAAPQTASANEVAPDEASATARPLDAKGKQPPPRSGVGLFEGRDVWWFAIQTPIPFMEAEKTVGLSFRVTPTMKRKLEAAAAQERRSLTNMFEVLVDDYCRMHGIGEAEVSSREEVVSTGKKRS